MVFSGVQWELKNDLPSGYDNSLLLKMAHRKFVDLPNLKMVISIANCKSLPKGKYGQLLFFKLGFEHLKLGEEKRWGFLSFKHLELRDTGG